MNIQEEIKKNESELISLRRHFHIHPELSEQEFHTMDTIEAKLKEWGIPSARVPRGGVLGFIDSGRPGYTVLLRADIDALPIEEDPVNLTKKKVCVSANPGVMHACGHDGHMAMQLIAGKILAAHKDEWDGRVILLFEEGEENGSRFILQLHKYLDDHKIHIDACYATHVRFDIPAGKETILSGPVMAGVFEYHGTITGRGGHGSRPDLAASPLDGFMSFYQALQTIRMQKISPEACLTFSIGSVHMGSAANVIPDTLTFEGTCRFFELEAGKTFRKLLWKTLDAECARCGCQWKAAKDQFLLPVFNDPTCAAIARKAVADNLGADTLWDAPRWMASESMALTLARWPGILAFTGIQDPETGSGAGHHTAKFDIGEKGLSTGVGTVLSYTLAMLKEKPELNFTPIDTSSCKN